MGRGYCHDCERSRSLCWTCPECGGEAEREHGCCRDCTEVECECGCGARRARSACLPEYADDRIYLASVACALRWERANLARDEARLEQYRATGNEYADALARYVEDQRAIVARIESGQ